MARNPNVRCNEWYCGHTLYRGDQQNSETVFFYERGHPRYEYTNFYQRESARPLFIDTEGTHWPTAEHYFQAQKFLTDADFLAQSVEVTPEDATRYADWAAVMRRYIASLPTARDAFELAQVATALRLRQTPDDSAIRHLLWDDSYHPPLQRNFEGNRVSDVLDFAANSMRIDTWKTLQGSLAAMQRALDYKFSQNPDLAALLEQDCGKMIVEGAGRNDHFWGNGEDGHGNNMLGKMLTMKSSGTGIEINMLDDDASINQLLIFARENRATAPFASAVHANVESDDENEFSGTEDGFSDDEDDFSDAVSQAVLDMKALFQHLGVHIDPDYREYEVNNRSYLKMTFSSTQIRQDSLVAIVRHAKALGLNPDQQVGVVAGSETAGSILVDFLSRLNRPVSVLIEQPNAEQLLASVQNIASTNWHENFHLWPQDLSQQVHDVLAEIAEKIIALQRENTPGCMGGFFVPHTQRKTVKITALKAIGHLLLAGCTYKDAVTAVKQSADLQWDQVMKGWNVAHFGKSRTEAGIIKWGIVSNMAEHDAVALTETAADARSHQSRI